MMAIFSEAQASRQLEMERFPVAMVTVAQLHCICSSAMKKQLIEQGRDNVGEQFQVYSHH